MVSPMSRQEAPSFKAGEVHQHGFVFRKISGNDAHTFSLIKTRDDQEIMIVPKEFAEDIKEEE